jgi:prolipoprotein diacylglyceryltransferase
MLGPLWSPLAHLGLEALAYLVGGRLFLAARARSGHDLHARTDGLWVLVGAVCGAALGSKLVVWLQYPDRLLAASTEPAALMAGKTIVGGLLGGWLGVEIAKRRIGLRRSTGDLFVLPLIAGMTIGRVGCLLGGVYDDTYGIATNLPWGLDLGDGIRRHPTALFEILALALLAAFLGGLHRVHRADLREGDRFRLFMAGYLAFRFGVEWLKPPHGLPGAGAAHTPALVDQPAAALYWGTITGIQLVCLLGLAYTAPAIVRAVSPRASRSPGAVST